MAGEWRSARFAQLCEHSAFGPRFAGELYAADGNVATLRTTDISEDGRIEYETMPLARLDLSRLQQHTLRPNDLVITRSGRIGTAALFNGFRLPVLPGAFLIRFRLKTDVAEPLYYRYFFNSPAGQERLASVATGSVQQNLNITSVHGLEVPVPPLPEQRAIAHILGTLDDKIELNRRMNETLEQQARALFKSWFVDFDPVRAKAEGRDPGLPKPLADLFPERLVDSELGEIPQGWEVAPMADHFEAVKGVSYKGSGLGADGMPLHNLNSVYEGGGYKYEGIKFYSGEYAERHIVLPGDVIVANTEQGHDRLLIGYAAIVPGFFGERGIASHHIYRLRPKPRSPFTSAFLCWLLNSPQMHDLVSGYANGTTVNMLPIDGVQKPLITCPSTKLVATFSSLAATAERRREEMVSESRTLAALRDTLLPKLISGELRVRDAEKFIEANA